MFLIHPRWFSRRISEPPIVSLRIQSPCQMMIGVYNHLQNAWYLGSITILRFGDWILRVSTPDFRKDSAKKSLLWGSPNRRLGWNSSSLALHRRADEMALSKRHMGGFKVSQICRKGCPLVIETAFFEKKGSIYHKKNVSGPSNRG